MRIQVLVIFSILYNISVAQDNWPPIGAYWNYVGDTVTYIGNPVDASLTIYVVDSTEINGYNHKITRQVGHEIISDGFVNIVDKRWDELVCCILNRNDSIFNVDPHFQSEQFLFSFNSDIGDSIDINQTIPYVVDTISYEIVNSNSLKKINYVKDCPDGPLGAYVLEKVGPLSIEDTIHPDSVCSTGFGNSFVWHFNCYSGDGIEYPSSCQPIKTGIETNEYIESNIAVSIVKGKLHIQANKDNEGVYRIINVRGSIVYSDDFKINDEPFIVDLPSLHNGIYLISVMTFEGDIESIKVFLSN